MASIFFSRNKGVASMPFVVMFSAILIVMTLFVFLPGMNAWIIKINDAQTIKEAGRLANAINEIHYMGDVGSVEKISINLPPEYYITCGGNTVTAKRKFDNNELASYNLNAKIASSNINYHGQRDGEISGAMTLVLRYGIDGDAKDFQIIVE